MSGFKKIGSCLPDFCLYPNGSWHVQKDPDTSDKTESKIFQTRRSRSESGRLGPSSASQKDFNFVK